MGTLEGIEVLIAAVSAGSFAGAARRLGMTPSAVSRRVALLEEDLGVPLLARTTRSLRLTNDGSVFYERCLRIVEEVGEAREAMARVREKPAGILRVDVPVALGRSVVVPSIPSFSNRYPEIRLDLTLRDRLVDPVAEAIDVLVRIGDLADSSLLARRIGRARMIHVASPAYLRARGRPTTVRELRDHACIGHLRSGQPHPFQFQDGANIIDVAIDGRAHATDADAIRSLAIGGMGIAALFDFMVGEDLGSGKLEAVLVDRTTREWPIHALYVKDRQLVPKVGVFLDWLARALESHVNEPRRRTTPPRRRPRPHR